MSNLEIPQIIPEANSDDSSSRPASQMKNSVAILQGSIMNEGSLRNESNPNLGLIEDPDGTEPTLLDGDNIDDYQNQDRQEHTQIIRTRPSRLTGLSRSHIA